MHSYLSLNRRHCIAGVASLMIAHPKMMIGVASAQTAVLERSWAVVQAVLDDFVAEHRAAGVCFGAMAGNLPPAYRSAGALAFDASIAMDENSICRVYSMTKNVTRIATLLLIEDGVLALDQPVASVLPEFRNLRVATNFEGLTSRPATRTMTIRHLITDSSGLGNWTPASDAGEALHRLYRERGITPGNFGQGLARPGYGRQPATLDELVARVAELPLAYEPGTVLHYSIGFDVMALVIERVTGMSYGNFLLKRLFGPLGMASTGFQVARADAGRLTSNYDATEGFANTSPDAPPDRTVDRRSRDQCVAGAARAVVRRWRSRLHRARFLALCPDAARRRHARRRPRDAPGDGEACHRRYPSGRPCGTERSGRCRHPRAASHSADSAGYDRWRWRRRDLVLDRQGPSRCLRVHGASDVRQSGTVAVPDPAIRRD